MWSEKIDPCCSGNDYLLRLPQFEALYELGLANGDSIDLPLLTSYRSQRWQQSISGNPYFFNAPFSGVIAQPAAWSFIYRFMANKSADYPEGLLTTDVLKSFYAVSGSNTASDPLTYQAGWEKFPDNWYKRNPVDAYTIPYLSVDIDTMGLEHPEFLSIGGNTGTTNSFTGVDPGELTGGVFNAATLTQGNNAMCYALEVTLQEAPDLLDAIYSDVSDALSTLNSELGKVTGALGCESLQEIDQSQFSKYPGYTNLGSDGSY